MSDQVSSEKAILESTLFRTMSRRQFLHASALGGTAALMAACIGTTPSQSVATPSSVDMNILMLNAQKLPDYWKSLVDLWNQNNKPKINLQITPEADKDVTLTYRTVLAGQNPPDMIFVFSGSRYMDAADAGLAADLTSYANRYGWKNRLIPGFYDGLTYKGKLYEMGYGAIPHPLIWYNRAIFQQLGIQVPADRVVSRDQMFQWVSTVRGAHLEPVALGNAGKALGGHVLSINFQRLMKNDYLEQLRLAYTGKGTAKFTDSGPIAAAKATQEFAQQGMFSRGFNALQEGDAIALFAQKKAAMIHAGYWGVLTLPANAPDIDIDFFQYPVLDQSVPLSIIDFPGFASMVSAKSKIRDQVAQLLDFAISQSGQRLFFEGNYGPPVTALPADVKLPHPRWADLLKVFGAVQHHQFQFQVDAPGPVSDAGLSDLQSLLDGKMTPEQWCSNVQKNIQSNIS
jgi:ABC-type glycerol-3-phosphate transport system substrate-binding protein